MEGRSSSVGFCGEHNFFALFPTMVLSVGDRVKSRATLYDAGTEDEEGNTFSQRQLGKGLGAFCYGAVTHVYRKVGRQSQKYRVRWDDGTIGQVLSEHLELVSVQEGSRDVGGGPDINEDQDFDRFVTVDGEETDEDGRGDQGRIEVGEVTRVGGVVEVGGVNWKRVENITRDVREGVERFVFACFVPVLCLFLQHNVLTRARYAGGKDKRQEQTRQTGRKIRPRTT